MTDDDLLALCAWSEAAGEPFEGKVAVLRVVRNRMALHYQSDGTVAGTVLHPAAFSGFSYDMVDGVYTKVAHTPEEVAARAENMRIHAMAQPVWADCQKAVEDSVPDSGFVGGPQFEKLTPATVLYCNPAISSPPWATPDNFVCQIFHHSFYEDGNA
jgi:spore germination cell wall hydrolase CwlJ-like protein